MAEEEAVRTDGVERKKPGPRVPIFDVAKGAADFVAAAAAGAASGAGEAAQGFFQAIGPKVDAPGDGVSKDEDGRYIAPSPLMDSREEREIPALNDRYEKLTRPGILEKAGDAVGGLLPDPVKDLAKDAASALTEQEILRSGNEADWRGV